MERLPFYPTAPGNDWFTNRQGYLTPEQIKHLKIALGSTPALYLLPSSLQIVLFQSMDHLQHDLDTVGSPLLHSLGISSIVLSWALIVALSILQWRYLAFRFRSLREARRGVVQQAEGTLRWLRGRYAADAGDIRLRTVSDIVLPLQPGSYRFYYLPKSRVVAAAERLDGADPFTDAFRRTMLSAGFPASALPFNREGRRSPEQLGGALVGALGAINAVFFGALLADTFALNPFATYLRLAFPLLIGVYCVTLTNLRWFSDTRPGMVANVEGHVERHAHQKETGTWRYTLTVAGRTFRVPKAVYDALDDRFIYRLYYSVRGGRLLNMEPIGAVTQSAT